MRNKKIWQGILIMIFGFLTAGCVTPLGKYAIVSTKNIDWNRASEFVRSDQRVGGEDMYRIIIIFPTKSSVSIEKAVDDALQKIPGAIALVDVVLVNKQAYFPFIYGIAGLYIEGTVIIDPKLASANEDSTK